MQERQREQASASFPVIGVGASAGGLEALRELLENAPNDSGMAYVIVQHLDPYHESMMAQLLGRATDMPVRQIEGGERLKPNEVYIIPPGHGLEVQDRRLKLVAFEQPRGLRRPIDDFLISLAQDLGPDAGCVILSGTGADGATGLRAVKEHGGVCVAQEPTSARYDGMPLSAVGTGLVDFTRDAGEVVACLQDYFARRSAAHPDPALGGEVAAEVDALCACLRDTIGHDFSGYKRSTVIRRIERRMQVLGSKTAQDYLERVRADPRECDALFGDLLINVTQFFRDSEMFEALRTEIIEPLIADAEDGAEIRVWVPGCSSGEEAYSIALLMTDAVERLGRRVTPQIFATDIDEHMLSIARVGRYPRSALVDIPETLREKYTVGQGDQFVVANAIRDLVRFSNHSLLKDPPFSKLDLVSCRNLMIYFGDALQRHVLPLFHYALRAGGCLFLGPSESVGRFDYLFAPEDAKARIFRRLPGRAVYPIPLPISSSSARAPRPGQPARRVGRTGWEEGVAIRRIVDRYAPAAMALDEDGAVLASYGRLSRYFEFPSTQGAATVAATLARPGLREVLAPLLRQSQQDQTRRIARGVRVQAELGVQIVNVICDPLTDGSTLLVLRDSAPFAFEADEDMIEMGPSDGQVQMLEHELRDVRHRLRTAVEELETANEELKSSNEEMMSMNEELQSTNEELSTVNDELKDKLDQLTVANADLKNFLDSTELAVVTLDRRLKIRTFTGAVTRVFPLQPTDRGRGLAEVNSYLDGEAYLEDAAAAAEGRSPPVRRLKTRDGERVFSLRTLSYRTLSGALEGATLVFTDVTEALELESALARERERLELAIRLARIGVFEYRVAGDELILDPVARDLFGFGPDEPGAAMPALLARVEAADIGSLEDSLQRAVAGEADYDVTFRMRGPDGATRCLRGLGRLLAGTTTPRLIGVTYDITAEWSQAEHRELMIREMNHRVKNLFAILSSIIANEAKTAVDPKTLAHSVQGRIAALGRAHSLAAGGGEARAIGMRELVATVLTPFAVGADARIGDDAFELSLRELTPMALILHEMATNSSKYGVLGDGSGSLCVSWRGDVGDGALIWEERFHAERPAALPIKPGFGTTLMDVSARQMGGAMERKRHPDGYVAIVRFKGGAGYGQSSAAG